MAVTQRHMDYANQYIKEKYDRINLTLPKGYKERIQVEAEKLNLSVNAYITELIQEDIWQRSARDNQKD